MAHAEWTAPGLRRPGREIDAGEGEGENNKQPAHEGCSRTVRRSWNRHLT
jgi:hypothetical protein